MAARKSTTARGLGWSHQQDADRLHRQQRDGTPCWWCELPMFTDVLRNWDQLKLAADHSQPRAFGGKKADRLLHGKCNSQRRDGTQDHLRPALLGCHPRDWARELVARGLNVNAPVVEPVGLAMDWR